jgi:hypothetical protein
MPGVTPRDWPAANDAAVENAAANANGGGDSAAAVQSWVGGATTGAALALEQLMDSEQDRSFSARRKKLVLHFAEAHVRHEVYWPRRR